MSLRASVARRFLATRLLGALGCAALAAAALAALALAEGGPPLPAALLGGAAACALGWRLRTGRSLAAWIEPRSDPDGLLRSALDVPAENPWCGRLAESARTRPVRFRPLGELRALAVFAAAAAFLALWSELDAGSPAAPAFRAAGEIPLPGADGGAQPPARDPAARRGREDVAPDAPGEKQDAGAPRTENGADDAGAPAEGEGRGAPTRWESVPVEWQRSSEFVAGRDFGRYQPYVDRYLRLKAERVREP